MPPDRKKPIEKDRSIRIAAQKAGKSKSAFVAEAMDDKPSVEKSKERKIRDLADWATSEEIEDLREALEIFDKIDEGDWE